MVVDDVGVLLLDQPGADLHGDDNVVLLWLVMVEWLGCFGGEEQERKGKKIGGGGDGEERKGSRVWWRERGARWCCFIEEGSR